MAGVIDERERDGVGRLVIITGLPASGKTTLATETNAASGSSNRSQRPPPCR